MNWYIVDKEYINFLVKIDQRVGYAEYGERLKLHVGILITLNDLNYYVPVSSAKPKHVRMSNSLDFHKIVDAHTRETYAVININNMIPVPEFCLIQLKYDKIGNYRLFRNDKEKTDYIYLLQKEKAIIDSISLTLQNKAKKLYQKYLEKPESILASRCCNFPVLEEKCKEYICIKQAKESSIYRKNSTGKNSAIKEST